MAITPLTKNKNHQSKQSPSQTFAKKFFSEVLDEACEKEQNRNIEIRINGYTKDALLQFCKYAGIFLKLTQLNKMSGNSVYII